MRLLLAIAIDDKIKEVRGQLTWSRDGYTGGRGCLLWPLDAFKVSIKEFTHTHTAKIQGFQIRIVH